MPQDVGFERVIFIELGGRSEVTRVERMEDGWTVGISIQIFRIYKFQCSTA